jgi:hypothetical protein
VKRTIAAVVTAILFAVVLWFGRGAPTPRGDVADADSPEACIGRMFDAAASGDVATYVDCFTGAERQRLERELADSRRELFGQTLKDAVASLRGRAVFADQPVTEGADRARFLVDRVYETRTERQAYQLVRQDETWRIESVRTAESFQPDTAYGTPVFEEPLQQNEEDEPLVSESRSDVSK